MDDPAADVAAPGHYRLEDEQLLSGAAHVFRLEALAHLHPLQLRRAARATVVPAARAGFSGAAVAANPPGADAA